MLRQSKISYINSIGQAGTKQFPAFLIIVINFTLQNMIYFVIIQNKIYIFDDYHNASRLYDVIRKEVIFLQS